MAIISNRTARRQYQIIETLVVGIALTGPQVKALRAGQASLLGSFIRLKDDQLWLVNLSWRQGLDLLNDHRGQRLLATRSQIKTWQKATTSRQTIIPLEIKTGGRYIKVVIARATGLRQYDQRQKLAKKSQKRQAEALLKKKRFD